MALELSLFEVISNGTSGLTAWISAGAVLVALVSAGISAYSTYLARTQLRRTRTDKETATAAAAIEVAHDAFDILVERLQLRFEADEDPKKLSLRQFRATATVAALNGIKAEELPISQMGPFIRLRSGIDALNQAMNREKREVDLDLQTYSEVLEQLRSEFLALTDPTPPGRPRRINPWAPTPPFRPKQWPAKSSTRQDNADIPNPG